MHGRARQDAAPPRTRIEVSYEQVVLDYLLAGCILAGGIALLAMRMFPTILVAMGIVLATLCGTFYFVANARHRCGLAACPGCNKLIDRLPHRHDAILECAHCARWLSANAGWLELVALDATFRAPVLTVTIKKAFRWPEGCVVCGARATRGERLEAPWVDERMGETAAILLVTGGHYFSNDPRTGTRTLSVPHCASCRGGASISCPDKRSLVVGFRSYVYWRKFTELNGLRRPRVTARS